MKHPAGRIALVIATLIPAALVLVHNLAFLAAYGDAYGAVLAATGHDGRWSSTVTVVIVLSALLGAVALARVGALWVQARSLERADGDRPNMNVVGYLRILALLWPVLAVVTGALFVGQENLESASSGAPLPGIEPLLSESSLSTLAILVVVTFVLSALGALLLWGHEILAARIAAALGRRRTTQAPPSVRAPAPSTQATSSVMSLNLAGRAPPAVLVS